MKYSTITSACIAHADSPKISETPYKYLHGSDVNQEFFQYKNQQTARLDHTHF